MASKTLKALVLGVGLMAAGTAAATSTVVRVQDSGLNDNDFMGLAEGFGNIPGATVNWDPLDDPDSALFMWKGSETDGYYSGDAAAYCGYQDAATCYLDIKAVDSSKPVYLTSFTLGSYLNEEKTVSWSVKDMAASEDGDIVASANPFTIPAGVTPQLATVNAQSNWLRIVFAGDWNTGINNIAYSVVPLPAAAWLFLSGIGALFMIGRRRRLAA